MQTVPLSPEFQVVIPQAIRQASEWKAGGKFQGVFYGKGIGLIPVPAMRRARGFLKEMHGGIDRDGAGRDV